MFFQSSLNYQPQLTGSTSIGGIFVYSGTAALTFSASTSATLTVGSLGIVNNSTNAVAFNNSSLGLSLGSSASFVGNGSIVVGSSTPSFGIASNTLTLGGTGAGSAISVGIASSTGSLVKEGPGTWELGARNLYSGTTTINGGKLRFSAASNLSGALTVNSGGTVQLAATDAFGSSAAVTLNGGTLQFSGGAFSQNFSGTPLNLNASSAIDFGSGLGATTLSFGSSSGQTWTGALSISNYSAGTDALRFGNDANALSTTQLAAINFSGFESGAQIDSSGYVTPVPEPSTYAFILGSIAFGLSAHRHRKKNGRSEC